MPDPTTAAPYDLPRLREQIRALFSDGELRDLCMDCLLYTSPSPRD